MSIKIGFYGTGNMGKAIINGIIGANLTEANNILVNDINKDAVEALVNEFGVTYKTQEEIARDANIVILSVKPSIVPVVLSANKEFFSSNTIIVSIAAGVSIADLSQVVGDKKLVRVMPNTPALVGEGMTAITLNEHITTEESKVVKALFDSFGKSEIVSEQLMDAVVGVSGSSPAYVYMFIEALADGAVLCGMPRAQAYEFAAQSVYGSAKMVLETKMHPGELKDMVCSPGGTTIAAVHSLEEDGFRNAVINAVKSAADKNKEMGKK